MVTKGDKIAFGLIAVLVILVIVFRKDIGSLFEGGDKEGVRKEKKGKKDKDKEDDKKEGRIPAGLPPINDARTVLYMVRA